MEGPNLDQHEIIKFLTLKGGRCTNFELVSNFRGALNHPQLQAEARLRFKDIVNTVAVVGEYQNVKYIELKKEYLDNNQVSESPTSQPSSLSSDSSYTSPLTQSFQPYWRYRLSTSTKVPILPVRSPDYDSLTKSQVDDSTFLERSVSESTLPQPLDDIQPPPRTRGRSSTAFNRSVSANVPERTDSQSLFRKTSFLGEECLTRRSSINGYPPQQTLLDFSYSLHQNSAPVSQQIYSNLPEPMPIDARRNSEVFVPERPVRSHCPPSSRRDLNRPASEHSTLSHSQSFSGPRSNLPPPNLSYEGTNCNSSNNLDKWKRDRTLHSRNGTERCPKRTGICSDDMLRELEDNPQQYMDNPISRSFNQMHGIGREKQIMPNQGKEAINYSSLPDYSYQNDTANKMNHQSSINSNENKPVEICLELGNERGNVTPDVKRLSRNVLSNYGQDSNSSRSMVNVNDFSLDYDTESISSSCSEMSNSRLEHQISRTESQRSVGNTKHPFGKIGNLDNSAPVPPERRRRHSKSTADFTNESDTQQSKSEKELPSSTGKVKDRVQHFDDLEKRRSHHPKRGSSSPLPDKENIRSSKTNLMEDDVSISVIEPKLKREWFVKAAQGDYYALVGLLKKEPKLAAIKDIASTALHWAAKHGEANIVKLIAGTYRVNPNVRSGYTPIHLATLYKHTLIVDLLVHTYGGDASIRDYSGKKASQYPENYVRTVAGLKTTEKRPLKARPLEKESTVSAFMRIGSLNLRKSRKSAVFASVRGRNWGTPSELRLNNYKSTRKKNAKMIQPEKKGDTDCRNDSDSDSAYGFYSKTGIKEI